MMPTRKARRVIACSLGFALGSLAAVAGPPQEAHWDCLLGANSRPQLSAAMTTQKKTQETP